MLDFPACLFDQSRNSEAVVTILDGDAALSDLAHSVLDVGKLLSFSDVRVVGMRQAVLGSEGCYEACLLYTSPSPRDQRGSRMPSSA